MIILVDFGSQTAHLIARRVRELGVEVKIVHPYQVWQAVKKKSFRDNFVRRPFIGLSKKCANC